MNREDASESRLGVGEILVARSNTPELVGRASLYEGYPQDLVASDLTIRLLPNADVNPRFLPGCFSYLYTSGYWRNRAGGASGSMKRITRTQLFEERIPVPTREEQDALAGQLFTQVTAAKRLASGIADESKALSQIPAALLRRAFSGEL
jgi:type I restriction enzyme S subunit